MLDDKFDLTWSDFGRNAERTFRNLANDSLFTDVTLISDDMKRIQAHKVILSSCSYFFNQVLSETSTEKPLLFLKGIRHQELQAIVKFIYVGTTEVSQEHLNNFMKAASDLRIEGLKENEISQDMLDNVADCQDLHTNEPEDSYYQPDKKPQDFDVALHQNGDNSSVVKTPYFERGEDGKYMCAECAYKTE